MRDLDEIWLTSGQPGHFGQAARLAESLGAIVFRHSKERANFAGNGDGEMFDTFFQNHHIPEDFIQQILGQLERLQQQPMS